MPLFPNVQLTMMNLNACCCSAYLFSCYQSASDAKCWMIGSLFIVFGGIRICMGVFSDAMFQ